MALLRSWSLALGCAFLAAGCGSTVHVDTAGQRPGLESGAELGTPAAPGAGPETPSAEGAVPGGPSAIAGGAPGSSGQPAGGGDPAREGAATPGATSAPAPDGSAPGPSRRTGPVRVGIIYFDSTANEALGTGDDALRPGPAAKALVAALNSQGGLAGRRIEPAYYVVDSTAANYNVVATEACAYFTEDSKVSVVLDYGFGMLNGFADCLAKRGVANIAIQASDDAATRSAPLFATTVGMTIDRRYRAVIEGLARNGNLSRTSKVGVILEGCPETQRAYDRTVAPTLAAAGIGKPAVEQLSCTTGFASAGEAARELQGAAFRFRSADIDRVLIVSDYEQVVLVLFAPQAESQGYRPGYMLTSKAEVVANRPSLPQGQWPQLAGVGHAPLGDVDQPGTQPTAVETRCVSAIKKGGAQVAGARDQNVAYLVCGGAFLLEAALNGNGGSEQGADVLAAVRRLGTAFTAPGVVQGATRFGPGRHDGPASVRPFAWSTACSCLAYTGAPTSAA